MPPFGPGGGDPYGDTPVPAGPKLPLDFDFHGVGVRIRCDDEEIRRRVGIDFSYFRATPRDTSRFDLEISAYRRKPDYDRLPPLKASIYTPRNICFADGDVTHIDYFGRALSSYDRRRGTLEIVCDDVHLLHETVFLSILSRVGELLEERHIHRVHALGVECDEEAALFMMPSGGGKTTLALEIVRSRLPIRILSEDSPLIDASGRVLPFPLRFGVKGEKPADFADEHLVYLERMEFDPKYLISLDAFEGRIATAPAVPRFLFFGERTLGRECVIRPASRAAGARYLLRDMVIGVGLYQGLEFLLQSSVLDLFRSTTLFLSRFQRAFALLRGTEMYVVELGRDPHHNATHLIAFLKSRGFGVPSRHAPTA